MANEKQSKMINPIRIVYDFRVGGCWVREIHISYTFEDYHRVVRILHENEAHYKVISVEMLKEEKEEQ